MDILGGISRLDYFIFTYAFAPTDSVAKKTSLVAYCVVESSAIVKDIDSNTLRVIISRAFKDGNLYPTLVSIYTRLHAAMFAPVSQFESLSLKAQEEEALETWYKPSTQQKGLKLSEAAT